MPKSTKKRKKLRSKKQLVKALDQVIRDILKDRDDYCVCCGKSRHETNLQVGHYISRRYYVVRWDLDNCHAQCGGCNIIHNRNPAPYTLFMERKFGNNKIEELEAKIKEHDRFTRLELEELLTNLRKIKKNGSY